MIKFKFIRLNENNEVVMTLDEFNKLLEEVRDDVMSTLPDLEDLVDDLYEEGFEDGYNEGYEEGFNDSLEDCDCDCDCEDDELIEEDLELLDEVYHDGFYDGLELIKQLATDFLEAVDYNTEKEKY